MPSADNSFCRYSHVSQSTWAIFLFFPFFLSFPFSFLSFSICCSPLLLLLRRWRHFFINLYQPVGIDLQKTVNHLCVCCAEQWVFSWGKSMYWQLSWEKLLHWFGSTSCRRRSYWSEIHQSTGHLNCSFLEINWSQMCTIVHLHVEVDSR